MADVTESVIKQEQIPETHSDSFDALKLGEDKLNGLGERLVTRYDELKRLRENSMWERDKALAFEGYHMMEKIKDLPYPGYPNLSSVLPRIGVDAFHANVMQSLFGNGFRDLVMPRYTNKQFVQQAKKAAEYLSYQLEQECNFYFVMDDADKKAEIYGIAYIEPYYVKEHKWETVNIKTTKVQIGQNGIPKEVTTTEKKKRKKTVFDGIKMESLPVDSIYVSPFVRDIEQAVKTDVVIKRFRLTWAQIQARTRKDDDTDKTFYMASQVDKLQIWATEKYRDDWDELTRKRVQYDGFYLNQILGPKSIDLCEAHFWEDIDDDGIEEKLIVTFQPESKVVVRVSLGPCRIVELRPRPVDERFYGEGIPRITKEFDKEWEAIHNARVATGQWENMPFGFYRAGGRFNPTEVTFQPGRFYPVDDPGEVAFAQPPTVRPSYFKEEELLFNYFERVLGISENLQGVTSSRELTATENMQVANKAMVRFSNPFTRIVMAVEKLLEHMWDLNRACAPEEKEYYITGIGSVPMFSKISKKDYSASLDFKLNVSTVFDEQLIRDTWLLVINTMRADPSFMSNPATVYEMYTNFFKAINVKLNLPVPPEAKAISPMEEHQIMLEGQDVDPVVGEDYQEHLKYHLAELQSKEIEDWDPEAIKRLMVHIDKTQILKQTMQHFNLNQSGQFMGMPSPMQPGAKPMNMTASRNPSQMFNNLRQGPTGNTQVNNASNPAVPKSQAQPGV